jgi:NADPH-dependent 2,4-dienoyl-CoA reductase/sulfur reductase-like enzyme
MNRIVIVGASLAGVFTARALRREGYAGELVMVGEEPHRPYDRPPLSKELLAGRLAPADLALETEGEDLGITWLLGTSAVGVATGPVVVLDDGRSLEADGLVIATGATARADVHGADLPGVHLLRTLDDALALREDLTRGGRVVVVGGGFIGSEVAATVRSLGLDVTLVVAQDAPLRTSLGQFADAITALHRRHGAEVLTSAKVAAVGSVPDGLAVTLTDGREIVGATVVLGLGSRPAVGWLADSEIAVDDGVLCDHGGATSLPGVVAVGDCAAWFESALGRHRRSEHWTAARERAAVAARTLLAGDASTVTGRPPYVWSDLYGVRLQLAGHPHLADSVTVEAGSPSEGTFLAVYRCGEESVAALGLNSTKQFNAIRRDLVTPPPTVPPSVQGAVA